MNGKDDSSGSSVDLHSEDEEGFFNNQRIIALKKNIFAK